MDIYLGKERKEGGRATINIRMGRRRGGFAPDTAWQAAWQDIKSGRYAATIEVDLRNGVVVTHEGDAFGLLVAHMMDMPVDGYTALLGLVDPAPSSAARPAPRLLGAAPAPRPAPTVVTFDGRELRLITPGGRRNFPACRGPPGLPWAFRCCGDCNLCRAVVRPDVQDCHALLKIRFVSGGTQPSCRALGGPDSWVPSALWQRRRWASLAGPLSGKRRRDAWRKLARSVGRS